MSRARIWNEFDVCRASGEGNIEHLWGKKKRKKERKKKEKKKKNPVKSDESF